MRSDFALFIIISITGHIPVFGLSVQQIPVKINTSEGANVSIECHIQADSKTYRIMVLWLKNNLTAMLRETFNTSESKHRLYTSGNVSATSTLHLHPVQLHHTGVYYCKVWQDVPILTTVYGEGTYTYIVNSSTDVTTSSPPLTTPTLSEDKVMISSLSVLGILVLIFCIAFVIRIHYKKQQSSDLRAKDALVDAGLHSIVTSENSVVYAAINIQKNQESVKTRNENCEALVSATVSCTEDTVTYSEVHIKSKLKDEG